MDQVARRATNRKSRKIKAYLRKLLRAGPDRHIELFLTTAITVFALVQWRTTTSNNASTAQQTDQLITAAKISAYAANQNTAAAQSFANSAQSINRGIGDAVWKLQAQADRMDDARLAAEQASHDSLNATIDNFHRDQRAWLSTEPVPGPRKAGGPIQFPIRNSGKTPALNVTTYFMGRYFATLDLITYEFAGVPIPLGYVAPNTPSSFGYQGQPQDADIAAAHKTDLFVVYGAVTYDDVFSAKHWITYCFYAPPDGTYVYCNRHNQIGDGPLPADALKRIPLPQGP